MSPSDFPLPVAAKRRTTSEDPEDDNDARPNDPTEAGSDHENLTKKCKVEASPDRQAEVAESLLNSDESPRLTTSTLHTIVDHDFEDYNEESDQDWDDNDGSESDANSSGSEIFYTSFDVAGERHQDVDVEGSEDEVEYKPDWTSYTEEEMEQIQEEARELGVMRFMEKFRQKQEVPVAKLLEAFNCIVDPRAEATNQLKFGMLLHAVVCRYLRKRRRLENVNTIKDVVDLIAKSQKIMIVTGAGVSVSCGIPDFRSETGIYSRLQEYQLDDPQQMFDIEYFRESPEIFYSFAKELYPSNYEPSPSHMFVKLIEEKGKLLRNYTQNIDTLERKANIKNVVNCHGSFATASCVACGYKCDGRDLEEYIFAQKVPPCPACSKNPVDEDEDNPARIMKPDITFFGEQLPSTFHDLLPVDTDQVDLLIVMGSSLKVSPVSDIMSQIPHRVPQILINRTPITHMTFDVQLLGNSDEIVPELCRMLDWDLRHEKLPGGGALSEESWKQSKEGPGDLREEGETGGSNIQGESTVWKFWRDGLYTFPGAVLDERYIEAQRCDERGVRGEEGEEEKEHSLLNAESSQAEPA